MWLTGTIRACKCSQGSDSNLPSQPTPLSSHLTEEWAQEGLAVE